MNVDTDVRRTRVNWPMNRSTRCNAVVNSVRNSSLRASQPDEFLRSVWKKTGSQNSCESRPAQAGQRPVSLGVSFQSSEGQNYFSGPKWL